MNSDIFVVNYPTVGSLFFKENYERYTGSIVKLIFDYREITKDKKIVAIAKDPRQLITAKSTISKNKHTGDPVKAIKSSIEKYILIFQTVLNNPEIICVDYEDLMESPLETFGKVAQKFNQSYLDGFTAIPEMGILEKHGRDPFGESMSGYEEVSEIVKMIDLSRCYEIYHELLKRSIR